MKRLLILAVVALFVVSLVGCQEEPPPPAPVNKPRPKPKPKVVAKVEEAPAKQEVTEYVYSPTGKRDPFVPLLQVRKPVKGQAAVPLTPLQKFDLPQFRILGIIIGKGEPTAMVAAPGGKSFIVRKGTKIGKNNGVITKITSDGIYVQEKYYDFSGAVRTNEQVIKLPPRRGV